MPPSMIESVGMEPMRYYKNGETIFAIDSKKLLSYGEIKDFCSWKTTTPHITTIFIIIVFDLPLTYGVVVGRDCH